MRLVAIFLCLSAAGSLGCSTTRLTDTSRTGVEQLLVSTAIDDALDKIEFSGLAARSVFIDEKQLDCVDKKYVIGSIRRRAFEAGAKLVEKPEEADIVLEVHSGAIGTDRSEGFVGIPAFRAPGPMPLELPELKLMSQTTQYGTAKIGIVAYDARNKVALSDGGVARARTNNSNWYVLGLGPYNSGSVRGEVSKAKSKSDARPGNRIALVEQPFTNPSLPQLAVQPPEFSQQRREARPLPPIDPDGGAAKATFSNEPSPQTNSIGPPMTPRESNALGPFR